MDNRIPNGTGANSVYLLAIGPADTTEQAIPLGLNWANGDCQMNRLTGSVAAVLATAIALTTLHQILVTLD